MFSVEFLRRECRLKPDETAVVGVSGGADSLYLLFQLHQIGQPLIAAILNHQLRPESGREVDFVRGLCAAHDIRCITGSADVAGLAENLRCSVEEAARIARYDFLFDTARRHSAAAVAAAHHADDQVETVLMHFLRGSGLDGLAGMRPRAFFPQWEPEGKIPLIRPILNVWRAEIEAWCRRAGLTPIQDASNFDTAFFRNRLRHDLIPALEKEYSPKIRRHIQTLSQTVSDDLQILETVTDDAWRICFIPGGNEKESILLKRTEFCRLMPAIRARLIRRIFFRLSPDVRDIGFDSVMRVLDFIAGSEQNSNQPWERNLWVALEAETILIYQEGKRPNPQNFPQFTGESLPVTIPGQVPFSRWQLDCRPVRIAEADLPRLYAAMKADRNLVYLDLDKINPPLTLRTAKEGEIFRPLGHGHRQKLSDFWINAKIPQAYRKNYPLVYDRKEPIWIPGQRPAEFCRLTAKTTRALCLTLSSSSQTDPH